MTRLWFVIVGYLGIGINDVGNDYVRVKGILGHYGSYGL
jgi:hypothetical protein